MKAMMTAALRAPFRLEKTKKIAEIRLDGMFYHPIRLFDIENHFS